MHGLEPNAVGKRSRPGHALRWPRLLAFSDGGVALEDWQAHVAVLEFGKISPGRYPGILHVIGHLLPDERYEVGFDIVLRNG